MKHRSTTDANESLEMLLDTICNTFGAVIFISMLVALLVSRSQQAAPATDEKTDPVAESAAISMEIQQAKERLRILSGQVRQQDLIRSRFASEESLALAGTLKQQTEDRVRLMSEKTQAVEQLSGLREQMAATQQVMQDNQSELDDAAQANSRLREELTAVEGLAGRTARIPRVRRTNKDGIVYALDDGRLFSVTTVSLEVDDVDCTQSTEGGMQVIRPRPGAGIFVEDSETSRRNVKGKFTGIDPKSAFVKLFVAQDSFGAFLPVKDTLVENGIEYEVLITDNEKVELFLGGGAREAFVQ